MQEHLHLLTIPFLQEKIHKPAKTLLKHVINNQKAPVTTAGAISPPILSGINAGICVNLNTGGNAANQDQNVQTNHEEINNRS